MSRQSPVQLFADSLGSPTKFFLVDRSDPNRVNVVEGLIQKHGGECVDSIEGRCVVVFPPGNLSEASLPMYRRVVAEAKERGLRSVVDNWVIITAAMGEMQPVKLYAVTAPNDTLLDRPHTSAATTSVSAAAPNNDVPPTRHSPTHHSHQPSVSRPAAVRASRILSTSTPTSASASSSRTAAFTTANNAEQVIDLSLSDEEDDKLAVQRAMEKDDVAQRSLQAGPSMPRPISTRPPAARQERTARPSPVDPVAGPKRKRPTSDVGDHNEPSSTTPEIAEPTTAPTPSMDSALQDLLGGRACSKDELDIVVARVKSWTREDRRSLISEVWHSLGAAHPRPGTYWESFIRANRKRICRAVYDFGPPTTPPFWYAFGNIVWLHTQLAENRHRIMTDPARLLLSLKGKRGINDWTAEFQRERATLKYGLPWLAELRPFDSSSCDAPAAS